jgi:membrane associated rhomboid family serine protease
MVGNQVVTEPLRVWAEEFMLHPNNLATWQFVTYAFLHSSFAHILGNMYFLYLFGNNVNDKLGNVGYTCFYLAGAVFSGIGHTLLHPNPVLGASGAVAAVTGAYLVLFPQTLIKVIYWFIFIGTAEFSALWFIAFKLVFWDNYVTRFSNAGIAYDAHVAGYTFGAVVMLLMLAANLLERSYTDLFSMIKQGNRRRKYRDSAAGGHDPFKGNAFRKKVETKQADTKTRHVDELRSKITTLINQKNLFDAANSYLEWIELDNSGVMPRQNQLDIANQLMSMGKWESSAQAYEKMLDRYGNSEYIEQVQLILGVLYSRYLDKPEEAIKHFKAVQGKLTDPAQKIMCENELAKLQK